MRAGGAAAYELHDVGMGEGEFIVEPARARPRAHRARRGGFLIRPNPGLPYGPVAETASGGELSRVALAIAAVASTGSNAGNGRSSSTR